jgi:hypothetical protein
MVGYASDELERIFDIIKALSRDLPKREGNTNRETGVPSDIKTKF